MHTSTGSTGRTLRHWTINTGDSVGRPERPSPTPAYSERHDGGQFHRLAVKLAEVKSELARRAG